MGPKTGSAKASRKHLAVSLDVAGRTYEAWVRADRAVKVVAAALGISRMTVSRHVQHYKAALAAGNGEKPRIRVRALSVPTGAALAPHGRCPACLAPVRRLGGNGTRRSYACGNCDWRGRAPLPEDATTPRDAPLPGVDQAVSAANHARVASATGIRRYVITAAQNATGVHRAFLSSLETYCRTRGAELLVIPYRYKNPTSTWSETQEHDDWWAPEIVPYLIDRRTELNPNLLLLADIKTQPTAVSPVTGFETLSGAQSAIIGHAKIEMVTVPVPHQRMPKILQTTGAVTERNYTPTKAGKKGEHHHVFGAALAEIDGDLFYLRQLVACEDGSFCDLDQEYDGDTVRPAEVEALVLGDVHVDFADPAVIAATFDGPDSIVATLRPKRLVLHDLLDQYAANHHHRGEVFTNFAKHHAGRNDVRAELDRACAFVDRHALFGGETIIVASNHNDALGRWVKEADPKSDPTNALIWAELFTAMLQHAEMGPGGARTVDPFAWYGRRHVRTPETVLWLGRDEPYVVAGVELSLHGDKGPNGSRGTRRNHTKIGTKVIIGHSHSPGVADGAWQTGTSTRTDLEYVAGPSGWLNTHCVLYRTGKRCLVTIINGKWRA